MMVVSAVGMVVMLVRMSAVIVVAVQLQSNMGRMRMSLVFIRG